jgi:hypothetical protein
MSEQAFDDPSAYADVSDTDPSGDTDPGDADSSGGTDPSDSMPSQPDPSGDTESSQIDLSDGSSQDVGDPGDISQPAGYDTGSGMDMDVASLSPPAPPGGMIWPDNNNPKPYSSSADCENARGNLQVEDGWNIACFDGDDGNWYIGIWPDQ